MNTRPLTRYTQLITDAERHARILVVDDNQSNLDVLVRILTRAGFSCIDAISDPRQIIPHLRFNPDVVLLDLHMPGVNGLDLIPDIAAAVGRGTFLPVLVLTGDSSVATRDAALAAGAKDFLTKPYEPTEVVLRVRNLIETRLLHLERTEELEAAKLEILERLARAADFRDESTYAHTTRVGELSAKIAKWLGLSDTEVEQLRIAARLHDIGKMALSDSILQKEGPLAPAEFRDQERHTIIGANILAGSRFPVLKLAESIALTHHEAWDGSGYPYGLQGEQIPLSGRIVTVADVFDALTHVRPYKQAWSAESAMEEIRRQRGTKFDPRVVDAFVQLMESEMEAQRFRVVGDTLRSGTTG